MLWDQGRISVQGCPNQYLPKLMERAGEKHVRAILETHVISSRALDILLRQDFRHR